MRLERIARVALILILIGLPAAALGYQFVLRPALADVRTIDVVAAAPEAGGFQPDGIRVAAGETVRLRFSVPDVTHGIAIGPGLGVELGQVDPGQVKEVELTFDRPGRYTFYCNTWCSPSHWRMRGSIEVFDPQQPEALIVSEDPDPVLDSLIARGVDIDAPHEAASIPAQPPSAARGLRAFEQIGDRLPAELADPLTRQQTSPAAAWASLVEVGLGEADAWDAVAYLWLAQVDTTQLPAMEELYARNCAACHGETGGGEGPGADVAQQGSTGLSDKPTVFSDSRTMLGGTGEIYYAKLRRGGMGTGMPAFGPLFTRQETWALVDYLWTFVLGRF